MDMLDAIDELDEELDIETKGNELAVVDNSAATELKEILQNEPSISKAEAEELTEAIRTSTQLTYSLIQRAHSEKAHLALGYKRWDDYVKCEFDMSMQRSYQLINLAKVAQEIESAAPDGTFIKLTEAQARDIKRELPRVTKQIREETANLEPNEAKQRIDEIIAEAREQQKADMKALKEKEQALNEANEEGYRAGLEAAADAILEADSNRNTDEFDERLTATHSRSNNNYQTETSDEDAHSLSPTQSMILYNFAQVLTTVEEALPSADELVELIPADRFDDLYEHVEQVAAWFNRLSTVMELKEIE